MKTREECTEVSTGRFFRQEKEELRREKSTGSELQLVSEKNFLMG
jgi:hypothetical protein